MIFLIINLFSNFEVVCGSVDHFCELLLLHVLLRKLNGMLSIVPGKLP